MREPLPLRIAVPVGAAAGAAIGVIAASLYLGWAMGLDPDAFDMFLLVKLGRIERTVYAEEIVHAYAAVAALAALGAGLAGASAFQRRLTTYGDAHWQSRAEMKANGLLGEPGRGFVCAKLGKPATKAPYVVACERPHVMVVAPTRAGKGVGFVIPNLLSFEGSAIVLDVKGELHRDTARWRGREGRAVHRFAPFDWDKPGARYNPLERIAKLKTPEQRYTAVEKLANLFLDKHNRENSTFSEAGQSIFVAACLLALQKGTPTLGAVRAIILEGQDKKKQYFKYSTEAAGAEDETQRLLWMEASSTSDKLLTSNIQALMTGGFKAWNNPAVRRATDACDFDFATFRAKPQSLYLCVAEDDIQALAPLLRLLFGDLIATLRHHEPGADEPHAVMILLDEFQQMGAMDYLERAIHTLASYGGRVALIAQSLASLDRIYGPEGRESLESGAALKLYIQPRDSRTVAELSRAVGSCTREAVTKSYGVWRGIGGLKSQSVREEERPLLSETAARTMDPDDVLVLASPLMPIRARRIKHYEDPTFARIMQAQKTMDWPVPPTPAAAEKQAAPVAPAVEAAPAATAAAAPPPEAPAAAPAPAPAPAPSDAPAPAPQAAPASAPASTPAAPRGYHGGRAPSLAELPPDAPVPPEAVERLARVEEEVVALRAQVAALLEHRAPSKRTPAASPAPARGPVATDDELRGRKLLDVTGMAPPLPAPQTKRDAPAEDRKAGRRPRIGPEQRAAILAMLEEGRSIEDVARALDVHRTTVGRISAARRRAGDTAAE